MVGNLNRQCTELVTDQTFICGVYFFLCTTGCGVSLASYWCGDHILLRQTTPQTLAKNKKLLSPGGHLLDVQGGDDHN